MAKTKTKGPEVVSPEEMSKKELEGKRKEITKYYSDNIPPLKIQLEYEELLRDIEKMRAERLQAQTFITRTMAEPPTGPATPPMPGKPAQKEFNQAMAAQGVANAAKKMPAKGEGDCPGCDKKKEKALKDATK
tara:strand:+ start:181 stop:579 length:399 start_codon:yes stop_codon:yes gene_type:complete